MQSEKKPIRYWEETRRYYMKIKYGFFYIIPVSYTHLDVYKRQEEPLHYRELSCMLPEQGLAVREEPVSYTHLDVYKRQMLFYLYFC